MAMMPLEFGFPLKAVTEFYLHVSLSAHTLAYGQLLLSVAMGQVGMVVGLVR